MYQGDYLKSYLEKNRIKAPELAKLLDVSRQVVYQYFKSQSLERETVEKICKVLKVPLKDIFPDAFEPDYILTTKDKQTYIVEIKTPEQETQGAWFRKFIVSKGLTDTEVAETLQVALPDISHYYHLKKFGTQLIQSLKKNYPDFEPKENLVASDSETSVYDIKDLIIENLLEQVNELKEKLAGYEHPRKRKHA